MDEPAREGGEEVRAPSLGTGGRVGDRGGWRGGREAGSLRSSREQEGAGPVRHRGEGEKDRDYVTVGFGHWEVTQQGQLRGDQEEGLLRESDDIIP